MAAMFMFMVFRIWCADLLKQKLLERQLKKNGVRHVHVLVDGDVLFLKHPK